MKVLFIAVLTALSLPALAYQDGTYSCKNIEGLPNNTYKVTTVTVASLPDSELKQPYVEMTRHFRQEPGNPESPIITTTLKGLAIISDNGTTQALMLGSLRLEFVNDALFGCKL